MAVDLRDFPGESADRLPDLLRGAGFVARTSDGDWRHGKLPSVPALTMRCRRGMASVRLILFDRPDRPGTTRVVLENARVWPVGGGLRDRLREDLLTLLEKNGGLLPTLEPSAEGPATDQESLERNGWAGLVRRERVRNVVEVDDRRRFHRLSPWRRVGILLVLYGLQNKASELRLVRRVGEKRDEDTLAIHGLIDGDTVDFVPPPAVYWPAIEREIMWLVGLRPGRARLAHRLRRAFGRPERPDVIASGRFWLRFWGVMYEVHTWFQTWPAIDMITLYLPHPDGTISDRAGWELARLRPFSSRPDDEESSSPPESSEAAEGLRQD